MDPEQRTGKSDRRRVIRGGRRKADHATVVRALRAERTRLPKEGPTVLVVERDSDSRELVREHLQLRGFRVDEAASATEALARASQRVPDVVLLNLALPDMDGVELIRRLRQFEHVKIAVKAGNILEDVRVRALAAGAAILVPEPSDRQMIALQLAWSAGVD